MNKAVVSSKTEIYNILKLVILLAVQYIVEEIRKKTFLLSKMFGNG